MAQKTCKELIMTASYKTAFISLVSCSWASSTLAASFGDPGDSALQDSATVCLNIGTRASLTGLDNFSLSPRDTDGAAGSLYEGADIFDLESNAPVRVIIDAPPLTNGEYDIAAEFRMDGSRDFYDTASDSSHSGTHTLQASARLGRISQQAAGDYSTTVTLTVTPQIGGTSGCGEFSNQLNTIDGWATLAFEDLYPRVGDGDYNDMVVRYHVQENYNAQQQLETVSLKFEPLARGAGYVHSFNLSLDGEIDKTRNATAITTPAFEGDALISVTYTTPGNEGRTISGLDKEDDITIFHNTLASLERFANVYDRADWVEPKFTAQVDITLANPELNLFSDRGTESLNWYRPYLSVKNTGMDIDLANVNPDNGMIDADGNPFGLMVPVTWEWPLERVSIEDAYPYFSEYAQFLGGQTESLSAEAAEWYYYPADAAKVINLPDLD